MIQRAFRIPAAIVATASLLFFANPIPVQADWWGDYERYDYGYYDDDMYDDDWFFDYYEYDYDDDRLAGTTRDYGEAGEERYLEERGTLFDDPGDEGWFDV